MQLSQKTTTTALLFAVAVVAFQTYYLVNLSSKLSEAQIGLGAAPTAVNFTDSGGAPEMVGGC